MQSIIPFTSKKSPSYSSDPILTSSINAHTRLHFIYIIMCSQFSERRQARSSDPGIGEDTVTDLVYSLLLYMGVIDHSDPPGSTRTSSR